MGAASAATRPRKLPQPPFRLQAKPSLHLLFVVGRPQEAGFIRPRLAARFATWQAGYRGLSRVPSPDPEAAARRLDAIARIPKLEATEDVRALGLALVAEGALPSHAEIDVYHIAIAAVNAVDYLLTWNCSHIANANLRAKIERVCRSRGVGPPIICTPTELLED